jgi:hypothetical protein
MLVAIDGGLQELSIHCRLVREYKVEKEITSTETQKKHLLNSTSDYKFQKETNSTTLNLPESCEQSESDPKEYE